jgi:hypothetical protein
MQGWTLFRLEISSVVSSKNRKVSYRSVKTIITLNRFHNLPRAFTAPFTEVPKYGWNLSLLGTKAAVIGVEMKQTDSIY